MTPQLTLAAEKKVDLEIERLTYSAYLLTLDPSVSLSVVVKALDDSLDEVTTGTNLLQRIVELSLQLLRHDQPQHPGCNAPVLRQVQPIP